MLLAPLLAALVAVGPLTAPRLLACYLAPGAQPAGAASRDTTRDTTRRAGAEGGVRPNASARPDSSAARRNDRLQSRDSEVTSTTQEALLAGYPWWYAMAPLLLAVVLIVILQRLKNAPDAVGSTLLGLAALSFVAAIASGSYAVGRSRGVASYGTLVRARQAVAGDTATAADRPVVVRVTRLSLDVTDAGFLILTVGAGVFLWLTVVATRREDTMIESHWGGFGGGLGGWRVTPALVYLIVALACVGMLGIVTLRASPPPSGDTQTAGGKSPSGTAAR
jgi:hypothetical protein